MRLERLLLRPLFSSAVLIAALLGCHTAAQAQNSIAAPTADAAPAPAGNSIAPPGSAPAASAGSAASAPSADPEEKKDPAGPPSLDEYTNVPTNLMIPEQAVVKDENGNDIADSHLTAGTKTGYEALLKLYQQGKFDEVAKGLIPLAQVSHHGAQELLGIMYEQGQGVAKDPHKAYDLLSQAAEANRPLAQHHLGVMYYQGDGVSKDPIMALMWLHIAIVHYPDGAEKNRAIKDRDSIYTLLTRREKERALQLAREWLGKKGESDLLDLQGN